MNQVNDSGCVSTLFCYRSPTIWKAWNSGNFLFEPTQIKQTSVRRSDTLCLVNGAVNAWLDPLWIHPLMTSRCLQGSCSKSAWVTRVLWVPVSRKPTLPHATVRIRCTCWSWLYYFHACVRVVLPQSTGQSGEFSCGWHFQPLFDSNGRPADNKCVLGRCSDGWLFEQIRNGCATLFRIRSL